MVKYDVIVIGAGHAGLEASLAPARMGLKTLMVTLNADTIGQMSCNPAIGGVGKGQLVKEIDALGGQMGITADLTGIQFRQLNASKGQAVRSSRCQSDRKQYKLFMQDVVRRQENLDVLAGEVSKLLVEHGKVTGVQTSDGQDIFAQAVIITTGTFLKGRIHIGKNITQGGRIGEPNSVQLADSIYDLGIKVMMFKTGTPPRLDGLTIDFDKLEPQYSDDIPVPFSFKHSCIPATQKLIPCHITYTTEETHAIIQQNMHLSPMYSGQIDATGVRYCPSIEDKLKKFEGKTRHQVFLEPEGLDTDEYYPNGISTGLPLDVQEAFVRTIPGLEKVRFIKPGYSIEHGVISATDLQLTLESKNVEGLYFAGQINGTTGYEEAAAQGLIAGINAALRIKNLEPFILGRNESYIGVLIDDLTTKRTEEPYRMFTSRVEYRLIVREDNADKRLAKYGYQFGLISKEDFERVNSKYQSIEEEINELRSTLVYPGSFLDEELDRVQSSPLKGPTLLSDLLKRPECNYQLITSGRPARDVMQQVVIDQVEYEIKYEGFIQRQIKDIDKFKHIEKIKIPEHIVYEHVHGLSNEIKQKLSQFRPLNLGQANRISGVTPAAITILMIYLKKLSSNKEIKK